MHVGREPKSSAYQCDHYQICSSEKLERIVQDFPDLKQQITNKLRALNAKGKTFRTCGFGMRIFIGLGYE